MKTTTRIIGIRVTPRLYALIKRVSKARGEGISSFIRRAALKELAMLNFLSDNERKALGLNEEEPLDDS